MLAGPHKARRAAPLTLRDVQQRARTTPDPWFRLDSGTFVLAAFQQPLDGTPWAVYTPPK